MKMFRKVLDRLLLWPDANECQKVNHWMTRRRCHLKVNRRRLKNPSLWSQSKMVRELQAGAGDQDVHRPASESSCVQCVCVTVLLVWHDDWLSYHPMPMLEVDVRHPHALGLHSTAWLACIWWIQNRWRLWEMDIHFPRRQNLSCMFADRACRLY